MIAAPLFWWLAGRDQTSRQGSEPAAIGGSTAREAVGSATFWLIFFAFLAAALAIGGFVVHLVPLLTDNGMSPEDAGGVAAVIGIFVILGRVGTGLAIDRLPVSWVAATIFLVAAIGCLTLHLGGAALARFPLPAQASP